MDQSVFVSTEKKVACIGLKNPPCLAHGILYAVKTVSCQRGLRVPTMLLKLKFENNSSLFHRWIWLWQPTVPKPRYLHWQGWIGWWVHLHLLGSLHWSELRKERRRSSGRNYNCCTKDNCIKRYFDFIIQSASFVVAVVEFIVIREREGLGIEKWPLYSLASVSELEKQNTGAK